MSYLQIIRSKSQDYGIKPTYFEKKWTIQELHGRWPKPGLLVYVLHGISKDEIQEKYKTPVRGWALDTRRGMDYVVQEIVRVIREEKRRRVFKTIMLFFSAIFLGLSDGPFQCPNLHLIPLSESLLRIEYLFSNP